MGTGKAVLLAAAIAAVGGWAGVAAAGGNPAPKEAKLIQKYVLPNGLTVVVRENHSSPVVAVQVWVKAGSVTEPASLAGMSHILEHMAFKGTERRGPGQIAREVEALGGEINAYTSFDQTVYHITIAGRFLDNALDILADTLGRSVFDADELAREKEVILEELRMNEDNPDRVVSKALFREAYRVHPYGRPVIGYADTIRKTGRNDLVSYFAERYVPGNMVLVVAGDVDPAAARPLIEKAFLPLKGRPARFAEPPAEPPQEGPRIKVQEREAKRAYLEIGFHGPSVRGPDVFAADLLSAILGEGQTSRLYREVKDRGGLVDSVNASSYTPRDPGMLIVESVGSPEKLRDALRAILVQAFRATAAPPEGSELARAKTVTESEFVYSLESQSAIARHVGFFETVLGDASFERKYVEKVRAVTADDVLAAARRYLRPENLSVSAIVPRGDAAMLTEADAAAIVRAAYEEATAPATKAAAADGVVRKEVLGNGIRVIVREDHGVPVVAVEAGFLAGVRAEPPGKAGVSTLTAELLTKGTARRTALEIAQEVENMAGALHGFSGRNSFGLVARFMRKDFEKGFRLFAESLRSPAFPADELEKKRREVLGRLKSQKDEMTQAVFLLFLAAHYGSHPYSRNPLGTEESVRSLTREDAAAFYERWADPRNMVIAVSGDIGVDEALDAVREAFGDFPRRAGYAPLGPIPVPPEEGIRKAEEPRDKQQAHFVIGYTGARFVDADRYAMDVLGAALAGMGGRLFTELRDKKSLAYSVTSFSSEQVDPGFFAFYMGTSRDKLAGAVADTLSEIDAVRKGGITEEDLRRAKTWMIGRFEIGLQSNGAYADGLMTDELYGVGYEELARTPERIQSVTLAQVNELAARLLRTDRFTIATVGGKYSEAGSAR